MKILNMELCPTEKIKTCFKCGLVKPIAEYYGHKKMSDGHLNKCKECTKKDVATREKELKGNKEWGEKEKTRVRLTTSEKAEIIELLVYCGMSIKEVAEKFSVSANTISTTLSLYFKKPNKDFVKISKA